FQAHLQGLIRKFRFRICQGGGNHRPDPSPRPRRKRGTENQATGKSRGGLTTKILALVDGLGHLVRVQFLPGQRGETTGAAALIEGVSFDAFPGDKAYDADWLRDLLRKRGIEAVIPAWARRLNPASHDVAKYKWRHLIGNFFQKLKEFKRIAVRACKTDESFAAMIHLAATVIRTR
ncbi:MAG: IS5 family transposase, partial [Rhodospirillales bacterium]|nr:IS5 family transposase [Rhodospirillales bacterium]